LLRIRNAGGGLALLALALLAGCAPFRPAPQAPTIEREQSRWVAVSWQELPGWQLDSVQQAWPALLRSCERPAPAWTSVCDEARRQPPQDADQTRAWLVKRLQPYRIEAHDGQANGLLTGYYEPQLDARRVASGGFRVPLYGVPADLQQRRPYWTRQQIDTLPAAQASLRGREIAYVADPLDALSLQIQGSGRLRLQGADGQVQAIRVAYAGHNDHPYRSIGRWLIEQGELPPGQASWPAIKAWAAANPARLNELLWVNPRYVFFRAEPLTDTTVGPRGAQGVPLTPGRSIAVDPRSVPYGTPVWIDTTQPLSDQPLRRLVLAQDTGSAIKGAVRADYFWGWQEGAAESAGRTQQPLRMWVLWPAGAR
jgi:membrane-bound lytic murein transglycosylase A